MSELNLIPGENGFWDVEFDGEDLVMTDTLEPAVTVSVETIARAKKDDVLPDKDGRRRGYCMDPTLQNPGDTTGSRIWLTARSKTVPALLPLLRQLFEECLAWMVQDGVASSVRARATIFNSEVIAILVQITRPDGTVEDFEFFYNWEAQRLARSVSELEEVI